MTSGHFLSIKLRDEEYGSWNKYLADKALVTYSSRSLCLLLNKTKSSTHENETKEDESSYTLSKDPKSNSINDILHPWLGISHSLILFSIAFFTITANLHLKVIVMKCTNWTQFKIKHFILLDIERNKYRKVIKIFLCQPSHFTKLFVFLD